MSQEDLDIITKERDAYRAILEAMAAIKGSNICPVPAIECLQNKFACRDCLGNYARVEMEKICASAKTTS